MTKTKTIIEFEDGTRRNIDLFSVNYKNVKKFLEQQSGLKYGVGDFYPQTIGLISAWTACHSPNDTMADEFLGASQLIIAHGLAEKIGGYTAFTDDDNHELLVYSPNKKGHFVIMIEEMFTDILNGKYDYSEHIKNVKPSGGKITLDSLRTQLQKAVMEERYELAAILRDKITKKKTKPKR